MRYADACCSSYGSRYERYGTTKCAGTDLSQLSQYKIPFALQTLTRIYVNLRSMTCPITHGPNIILQHHLSSHNNDQHKTYYMSYIT